MFSDILVFIQNGPFKRISHGTVWRVSWGLVEVVIFKDQVIGGKYRPLSVHI